MQTVQVPVDNPVGRWLSVQVAKGDDARGSLRADADRQELMIIGRRAENSQP